MVPVVYRILEHHRTADDRDILQNKNPIDIANGEKKAGGATPLADRASLCMLEQLITAPPPQKNAASLSAGVTTDSRCLDAFTVALNHTSGVEGWCIPTKQLQLASLPLCVACRSVRTLALKIKYGTPRRLLADANSSPPKPGQAGYTRVPRFRARGVHWNSFSFNALRPPMYSLTHVEFMDFCYSFGDRIEPVAFLTRLRTLRLGHKFNHPVDGVTWPRQLETLELSTNFNHPVDGVDWPPQLKRLTFGARFNQTVKGVAWPRQLQHLELDCDFNQPVDGVTWPPQLTSLTFGKRFNQPIDGTVWPRTLVSLDLRGNFDQPIDLANLPPSLQSLYLERGFNKMFRGGMWPPALRLLCLGEKFNQPVRKIGTCIPHLKQLRLEFSRWDYSHSLARVQWPEALGELVLSDSWYQFCLVNKSSFPARFRMKFLY